MIVPQYWAESRRQGRVGRRQVTVKRYGWSDASVAEAQVLADSRAREAYDRIVAGENLPRRELKRAYNGAEGVPIREEIVGRHGDTVVTRNSYGARCLNTPDVLFADVDFEGRPEYGVPCLLAPGLALCAALAAWFLWRSRSLALLIGVAALPAGLAMIVAVRRMLVLLAGGPERVARRRIDRFIAAHRDWHLRIYRTPAGFRVLAMHRTFSSDEAEVAAFFEALGTDPVYARMCMRQRCFRARVSAKPWRVGIAEHIRPHRGVWPVDPAVLPDRKGWVVAYEEAARAYAACRLVETAGSGFVNDKVRSVQAIHDELCQATSGLPIA